MCWFQFGDLDVSEVRTINHGVVDPKQLGEEQRMELVENRRIHDRKFWEFSGFLVAGNSTERGETKQKKFTWGKKGILHVGTRGTRKHRYKAAAPENDNHISK